MEEEEEEEDEAIVVVGREVVKERRRKEARKLVLTTLLRLNRIEVDSKFLNVRMLAFCCEGLAAGTCGQRDGWVGRQWQGEGEDGRLAERNLAQFTSPTQTVDHNVTRVRRGPGSTEGEVHQLLEFLLENLQVSALASRSVGPSPCC